MTTKQAKRCGEAMKFEISNYVRKGIDLLLIGTFLGLVLTAAGCSTKTSEVIPPPEATVHILFVGDSFTHGRYLPVRTYNSNPDNGGLGLDSPSTLVVDENFGTSIKGRMESQPGETGPWGGIPGIFAELSHEAGLPYDVHIEAISETSLDVNYKLAQDVIDQSKWNTVVLQDASFEPIPPSLSQDNDSSPSRFCDAVQEIEQGVHGVAPQASVYLYETWAPADTTYQDVTASSGSFSSADFLDSQKNLTNSYHDAYAAAASQDGHIAGIAPVGDAFALAWTLGVANPDPYGGSAPGVPLSFGYQAGSEPKTTDNPTDPGFHHPSIYGAYLSGLVLFQEITGHDVRSLGDAESAAASLGIPATVAVQLQSTAWQVVTNQSTGLTNPANNTCKTGS
jgi:hypothetical protein